MSTTSHDVTGLLKTVIVKFEFILFGRPKLLIAVNLYNIRVVRGSIFIDPAQPAGQSNPRTTLTYILVTDMSNRLIPLDT